ncbi:MAG: hypothetical protein KQH79_03250 [Bacteroidetes bacterium]|nr:hypothetical protein [Bacteroidota bacterium]
MKRLIYLFIFTLVASTAFVSCDDDDDSSPFKTVTIGAQDNTDMGGFYSFTTEKVYNLADANTNQASVDLLCFYELTADHENYTTLSSPGANIKDIFVGDDAPENWTTLNTTYFYELNVDATVLTVAAFDALTETDALIQTLFNAEEAKRKAKDLQVNDMYSFQTEDGTYGIFKVISVVQGETGYVQIKYILKK